MEKFIKQHRHAFEVDEPSPEIWDRIDRELRPQKVQMVELKWVYRIAASVAIVLSFGVLLGYYVGQSNSSTGIDRQLAGMEQYYQQKMEDKMRRLASYEALDMVRPELQNLEQGYAQLTSETPLDQDKYLHAVMTNFEARLVLIEKVLQQMEKYSNEEKTEENEVRDLQI